MSKGKTILLVVVIGLGALLFWQQKVIWRLEKERTDLMDQAARLSATQEQKGRLAASEVDATELARLRADQGELLRLRNEVSQLRQQAKKMTAKASTPAQESSAANPQDEIPISPVETFTASNRVALAWKQTLVTGGWSTEPGKRTFFFIQPEPKALVEDSPQPHILITARVVEIPEQQLGNFGLESLTPDSKEGMHQAVYSAEQYQALVKAMENAEGVNIVSNPRIQTSDGVPASLHIGSTLELPSGDTCPIGTTMEVSPRLLPDGSSVVLSISSEIRKPSSGGSSR